MHSCSTRPGLLGRWVRLGRRLRRGPVFCLSCGWELATVNGTSAGEALALHLLSRPAELCLAGYLADEARRRGWARELVVASLHIRQIKPSPDEIRRHALPANKTIWAAEGIGADHRRHRYDYFRSKIKAEEMIRAQGRL